MKKVFLISLSLVSIILSSCDNEDTTPDSKVSSTYVRNLPADTVTGFGPMGQPLGTTDHFTFFRFSDSSIVSLIDSASVKWDLGFRGSTIIVNSGTSGPGQASAFIYDGLFSALQEVPNGIVFKVDTASTYAIGKLWSTYNPAAMILSATPGKVIVIKTADAKYAKVEILSYYKNSPPNPNATQDLPRYYTFRYVLQTNGTKSFE
ncbi:MAG: HmuY family protein [Saprospiraceae bacterium]